MAKKAKTIRVLALFYIIIIKFEQVCTAQLMALQCSENDESLSLQTCSNTAARSADPHTAG